MNINSEPMLAMFNLGGGEVVLILVLTAVLLAAPVLAVVVALWLLVKKSGSKESQPTPPIQPPPAQTTKVLSKTCPQCGAELRSDTPEGLCPACLLKQGVASEAGDQKQKPFVPPEVAELAAKFPQLEILELIGRGGMGAVYKARQKQLDRIVALKILPPGIGNDPAFSERFAREAKALARLNHPGIVTLFEFGSVVSECAQAELAPEREIGRKGAGEQMSSTGEVSSAPFPPFSP